MSEKKDKILIRIVWLFASLFILGTFLPRIMEPAMFIDGLIYATISHNMANDIGNFWNPEIINFHVFHYLNGPIFYEHPPLMFYLESLFFRILGDGFIVERIFCSVILLAHVLLILLIFKLFFPSLFSTFSNIFRIFNFPKFLA